MITTYEMAYVEVLAVLKNYLSEFEFNKIPKERIDFFENNKDNNYHFEINKDFPIEKQNLSEKANAILVILYRDYFANEQQKQVLKQILELNDKIKEKDKQINNEKFNILFENKKSNETVEDEKHTNEVRLIEVKKEKWYKKFFMCLKRAIKKFFR